MTALDWASRSGRDDIIRLVSSKARRPNKRGAILSMADTRAPEGSPPPAISSSPGSFVAASPSFGSTSSLSASFDGGDEPVAMRQPRASTAASIANNPNRSSIFGGLRKLATSIKPPLSTLIFFGPLLLTALRGRRRERPRAGGQVERGNRVYAAAQRRRRRRESRCASLMTHIFLLMHVQTATATRRCFALPSWATRASSRSASSVTPT